MRHNRLFLTLVAIAAVSVAMADRKMTVRNEETGEEMTVTVPDGLKIYEYNNNWLDSIPYLTEHARYGEPWAYEALGDCHLHGKGGVDKSIMNALGYYDLAGINPDKMVMDLAEKDNENPMVVFARMMDYIEDHDYDHILCAIDTLHKSGYHSADILQKYVKNRDKGMDISEMIGYVSADDTDPDAALFAIAGIGLCINQGDSTRYKDIDFSSFRPLLMNKIPHLYATIGEILYDKTTPSFDFDEDVTESPEDLIATRRKAVELMLKADELGVLNKKAARQLYDYCLNDPNSDWVDLTEEDLNRIAFIADL